MVIHKAYKVRLYPNKAQEQELIKIIGACRFIYNHFLEQRKNYYLEHKKTLPYAEMSRQSTKMRKEIDWLGGIHLIPIHQAVRNLDKAYNRFFKKTSCFPRFKSKKDTKQSFQKNQDWRLDGNKIKIQNNLIVRFRGNISPKAELGTLIISKMSSGKWYASICAKEEVKQPKRYSKPVGIDIGITFLAALSTGKKYEGNKSKLGERIGKLQREFARKKKGSNRREKARIELARLHEKVANQRLDYLHKVSHDITRKNHAVIAVEDLDVIKMMKGYLARSIADVGMSEFLRQIKYKQEWRGGKIIEIDRFFPSSKTCSKCGFITESLPLAIREWKCPKCKTVHDRDINAAKNILNQSARNAERGDSKSLSLKRKRRNTIPKEETKIILTPSQGTNK